MTHEMLRSDAPWAIALMLMLWRPSAPNSFPATPGRPFIPSPTTATIAWSGCVIEPRQLLRPARTGTPARSPRSPRDASSLADREADRVLGRRLGDQDDVDAVARERPEQPLGRPRHADHARAAQRQQRDAVDGADALGDSASSLARWLEISVPGADGLNVFLMRIGMRFATAGAIVAECSTLAPKYDSSIASS